MFQDFVKKLLVEILEEQNKGSETQPILPETLSQIGGSYTLEVEDLEIVLTDEAPGLSLYCHIETLSSEEENREELFQTMLRGNFLGQATRKASLGLDVDGAKIILVRHIPKISTYKEFRYSIDDFTNAACFWKNNTRSQKNQVSKT